MREKRNSAPTESQYQKIVETYLDEHSISRTAVRTGTTEVTVRRVLLTEGLWTSERAREVKELADRGLDAEAIAKELHLTVTGVRAYLPYSRGKYGDSDSQDARYSREYRERVTMAQDGVSALTGELEEDKIRRPETPEPTAPVPADLSVSQPEPAQPGSVLKLRLELGTDDCGEFDPQFGMNEETLGELLRLGQAKQGFSREVLVPGSMHLRALHFGIMRMFGWQNSHLHNFSLPQDQFDRLTGGTLKGYDQLCGALFRFPGEHFSDLYYGEDYNERISVKSWLRKLYTGPYRNQSIHQSFLGARWDIQEFLSFYQGSDSDTLKQVERKIYLGGEFNELTERLTLGELMLPEDAVPEDDAHWKKGTLDRVHELWSKLEDKEDKLDQMEEGARQLEAWRESLGNLEKLRAYHRDTYEEEARERTGLSYDEAVSDHKEQIALWTRECRPIFQTWNPVLTPHFSQLMYHYDYGDDWWLRITAQEVYRRVVEPARDGGVPAVRYLDRKGNPVEEPLCWQIQSVENRLIPLCTAADGLTLMDDAGGIYGYLDTLRILHGTDREEARTRKSWASMQGWTGRKTQPEHLL